MHARGFLLAACVATAVACVNREQSTKGEPLAAAANSDPRSASPRASRDAGALGDAAPLLAPPGTTTAPLRGQDAATDATAPCGPKGAPPCPLQAFMRAEMVVANANQDFAQLTIQFERLARLAPGGLVNWASIASDGAAASRAGERASVHAACRGCHEQYADLYINRHRASAL